MKAAPFSRCRPNIGTLIAVWVVPTDEFLLSKIKFLFSFIQLQTVAADGARIDAAFAKYFYRPDAAQEKDSYTIIVSHANVIRYLVCRWKLIFIFGAHRLRSRQSSKSHDCRVLQFDTIGWLRFSLHNGSITWLSINASGAVRLRCLGEAGYMEPAALTIMNFRE